jgi:hypothetical protein
MNAIKEIELYQPVKSFLEGQGYNVKGEVGAADVVACRDDQDPVIVELKTAFSLALFHQAIDRLAITDLVYVAVPHASGRTNYKAFKNNVALCRRLGLGLLTVRLRDGFVEAHVDPVPYSPRKSKPRKSRLLREFNRLVGDPNMGGSTRVGLVTAYRQDALRCLKALGENGATKAASVARISTVPKARQIMADDHYGWFERVDRGVYALSPKGVEATGAYKSELATIAKSDG